MESCYDIPIDPTAINACSEAGLRPGRPEGGASQKIAEGWSSSSCSSWSWSLATPAVSEAQGSEVAVTLIVGVVLTILEKLLVVIV